MKQHLSCCLGAGYIQTFQDQQVTAAAQVGKKINERERLMRRLVPMAVVDRRFAQLRPLIDNLSAAHSWLINYAKIGTGLDHCRPWITP
jgi:hypothetical protein